MAQNAIIMVADSEIGTTRITGHMWGYASLDDRAERRGKLAEDQRWQAFIPRLSVLIESSENRILLPTDFSPLR